MFRRLKALTALLVAVLFFVGASDSHRSVMAQVAAPNAEAAEAEGFCREVDSNNLNGESLMLTKHPEAEFVAVYETAIGIGISEIDFFSWADVAEMARGTTELRSFNMPQQLAAIQYDCKGNIRNWWAQVAHLLKGHYSRTRIYDCPWNFYPNWVKDDERWFWPNEGTCPTPDGKDKALGQSNLVNLQNSVAAIIRNNLSDVPTWTIVRGGPQMLRLSDGFHAGRDVVLIPCDPVATDAFVTLAKDEGWQFVYDNSHFVDEVHMGWNLLPGLNLRR